MKILFTICGRAGSKGIHNKNIKTFCEFPLPLYSLSALDLYLTKHPECDADIALNTDSLDLKEILCTNTKRNVYYIPRKHTLTGDFVAKKDVIKDTLIEMENLIHTYGLEKRFNIKTVYPVESIMDKLEVRTVHDIENLIQKFRDTSCDVVFSAVPSRRSPYFNMVYNNNGSFERIIPTNFTARQEAPDVFDMNASLYAYRCEHLKAGYGALEGYNELILMYDTAVLDLDHENDFTLMQVIAHFLFQTNQEFNEVRCNILNLV